MSLDPLQSSSHSQIESGQQNDTLELSWLEKINHWFWTTFSGSSLEPSRVSKCPSAVPAAPLFFKITGNAISASKPVYLLAVCQDLTTSELPPEVLVQLKSCEMLVCPAPIASKQEFAHFIREMQKQFQEPDLTQLREKMLALLYGEELTQILLQELPKRIQEYRTWGPNWIQSLSLKAREKIQSVLNEYSLKLEELHPLLVKAVLMHRIGFPKKPTCLADLVQSFKEQNKNIQFIENPIPFSTEFDLIVNEWEAPFELHHHLAFFEKLIPSFDELISEQNNVYRRLAQGIERFDLNACKAEKNIDLAQITEQDLWRMKLSDTLYSEKSVTIIVSYDMLPGFTGLLNSLEGAGYKIQHLSNIFKFGGSSEV